MPHQNAVLALRRELLTQSTRPFQARGHKVKRCQHCLVAQTECICQYRPDVNCRSAVCFLMYQGECFKPSNTGRIVADVVKHNFAFNWQRTNLAADLQALLSDPAYQPIVVFPQQYAEPQRWLNAPFADQLPEFADAHHHSRIPLFILLDGTWREAKKMFKSPYLSGFPVLGIQPQQNSAYRLREAAHLHQLCTAEVVIEVLKLAGDQLAARALTDYFEHFREAYLIHKPHLNPQQNNQSE